VTTTPQAQAAIGQIVHLVQGQGGNLRMEWKVGPAAPAQGATFTPLTPPTPPPALRLGVPAAPAAPAAPRAPTPAKPPVADPAKPAAAASPAKVDVNVILEKALKLKEGVKDQAGDLDLAKLQELLKTLKPLDVKVEVEEDKTTPKPSKNKKPADPAK
jgi:hypothetical protein